MKNDKSIVIYADLKNAEPALTKLFNNTQLPVKTAHRLSLLVSKVTAGLRILENMRVRLVYKYGQKDKKGFSVPAGKINQFKKEMEEILSEPVDIQPVKLTGEELKAATLSPADIAALSRIIEIDC